MRYATRITTALTLLVLILAASQASAQAWRLNQAQVNKMTSGWPMASRQAIMDMTRKYGPPASVAADMAVWGRTGPWKRTIVYKMEHPHEFPMHHTDVMQQWIDYKAPP